MGNSTPTPRAKCTKLTGQRLLPLPRDLSAKIEGLSAPTSKQIQLDIRHPFIYALRGKYTQFILKKKLLSQMIEQVANKNPFTLFLRPGTHRCHHESQHLLRSARSGEEAGRCQNITYHVITCCDSRVRFAHLRSKKRSPTPLFHFIFFIFSFSFYFHYTGFSYSYNKTDFQTALLK